MADHQAQVPAKASATPNRAPAQPTGVARSAQGVGTRQARVRAADLRNAGSEAPG